MNILNMNRLINYFNYRKFYFILLEVLFLALFVISCEDTDTPDTLDGTWWCNEYDLSNPNSDGSPTDNFYVDIGQDYQDSLLYTINNFNNADIEVFAHLQSGTLVIESQQAGGYIVQGTGYVSSDFSEITWNYTVDDGSGVPVNYNAVYQKRK
jgi:hypothetical protein